MKKLLVTLCCGLFLVACGGNESEYDQYYDQNQTGATDESTVTDTKVGADAGVNEMTDSPMVAKEENVALASEYEKGAHLISMSDCLSCHEVDRRLIGPSYVEVAQKYAFNDKNVDYLAGKIIEGGAGVWGQVPMTPHPDLKEADAKEMARYILSLNQQ
ncbi:MAG: c-type cytochrome [Hymenobacteraceae bacterium]|nr:c-type cytochrome [Hymenobacteraceae bacterium]